MAKRVDTSYTVYELTDAEYAIALTLSPETKMYIQNKLAEAAEQRISHIFDHLNTLKFVQEEAYFQARMDVYKQILAEAEQQEERAREMLAAVGEQMQQTPQSPDIV